MGYRQFYMTLVGLCYFFFQSFLIFVKQKTVVEDTVSFLSGCIIYTQNKFQCKVFRPGVSYY